MICCSYSLRFFIDQILKKKIETASICNKVLVSANYGPNDAMQNPRNWLKIHETDQKSAKLIAEITQKTNWSNVAVWPAATRSELTMEIGSLRNQTTG